MTTKKYHNKEFGVIKVQDIANKTESEIKSLINEKTKSHSNSYLLTMPNTLKNRAIASSDISTQMLNKLRTTHHEANKNFFELELEKEFRNCICSLNNIVSRYYNSCTFREEKIFPPDIYKVKGEIDKIYDMINNIVQLEKELTEKEKTFLD